MNQQTAILLLFLSVTLTPDNVAFGVDVSSQIDLGPEESKNTVDDSKLTAFVNVNEGADTLGPALKTSNFRSNVGQFVGSVDSKKRRSHFIQGDHAKQPTVINNVEVVVNGNDSKSADDSCKDGVCEVSVSSKLDDAGNIVTDVHITIVTKLNTTLQVDDIPVIDGVRGLEDPLRYPPDFHLLTPPRTFPHLNNNIPQIQTRHQDSGASWYQGRRTFQRPQPTWYYYQPGERWDRRFQGRGRWTPSRPLIDDKIEPPLSRTQPSDK